MTTSTLTVVKLGEAFTIPEADIELNPTGGTFPFSFLLETGHRLNIWFEPLIFTNNINVDKSFEFFGEKAHVQSTWEQTEKGLVVKLETPPALQCEILKNELFPMEYFEVFWLHQDWLYHIYPKDNEDRSQGLTPTSWSRIHAHSGKSHNYPVLPVYSQSILKEVIANMKFAVCIGWPPRDTWLDKIRHEMI